MPETTMLRDSRIPTRALLDADFEDDLWWSEPKGTAQMLRCDWCGSDCAGDYAVALGRERHRVCPICWGRAPTYIDLRRDEGMSHESVLRKLCGAGCPPQ